LGRGGKGVYMSPDQAEATASAANWPRSFPRVAWSGAPSSGKIADLADPRSRHNSRRAQYSWRSSRLSVRPCRCHPCSAGRRLNDNNLVGRIGRPVFVCDAPESHARSRGERTACAKGIVFALGLGAALATMMYHPVPVGTNQQAPEACGANVWNKRPARAGFAGHSRSPPARAIAATNPACSGSASSRLDPTRMPLPSRGSQ
jgi:hypothetical protein